MEVKLYVDVCIEYEPPNRKMAQDFAEGVKEYCRKFPRGLKRIDIDTREVVRDKSSEEDN